MSLFENYEEEYLRCARLINQSINVVSGRGVSAKDFRSAVVQGEIDTAEAESYIKAMEAEVRSLHGGEKRTAQNKLDRYRADLQTLRRDLQRSQLSNDPQGSTGAESYSLAPGTGAAGLTDQQAQMLLAHNEILDGATRDLEEGRRLAADSEMVNNGTLSILEEQKETLIRAGDDVKATRGYTREAQRVLRTMGNRAIMHKLCLYFIILVLLVLIGVVTYYLYIKPHKG